ncbi:MAG TPA: hypothetical protein PKB14_08055 [Rubrivivax sp.]|nr:hypothetical protein [Rubrivivax sp.]
MSEETLEAVRELLAQCTPEERAAIFKELRATHPIHPYEAVIGAPAEMILEAVYRAPELTRRMLRGVIADAAFRTFVVGVLAARGWRDVTPEGNFAYDYSVDDGNGPITVQVKLQRSERGAPVVKDGKRYGFDGEVFMAETQKTRTGTDGDENQTRPYRYGEFDVLAVSMQPSSGNWGSYMYTLGRWLLPGKTESEMATLQPVTKTAGEFWADDFEVAARWFRVADAGKRLEDRNASRSGGRRAVAKKATRKRAPK